MQIINITLKIEDELLTDFEDKLRLHYDVVSFKTLPNTDLLHLKDPYFRKIVKKAKEYNKIKEEYINKNNK